MIVSEIDSLGSRAEGAPAVAHLSPNYEYVLSRALAAADTPSPRILDYGSGQGQLLALAADRGVDMYGADLEGIETSERARLIVDGVIPYPDRWFDVVVSNQVFEHIADPLPVLKEISRVLKPGGTFIALFPDRSTWFEGHVGLYFVHWFEPSSRLLRAYLIACHRLGLGYFRDGKTAGEWADWVRELMITEVFYHRPQDVRDWWQSTFGELPRSMARDWMISRISKSRLHRLAAIARRRAVGPILEFICRIRAGLVVSTRRLSNS